MLARRWEGDMYYMTTFTTLFAASLATRRDAGGCYNERCTDRAKHTCCLAAKPRCHRPRPPNQ